MTSLLRVIRCMILSPEVVAALFIGFLYMVIPHLFTVADSALGQVDRWPLLSSAVGLVGAAVAFASQVLFPKGNYRSLVQWHRYPELRLRTLCGVILSALGAGAVAIGVLGRGSLPDGLASAGVVGGFLVALVAVFTMFCAGLVVRSLVHGGT